MSKVIIVLPCYGEPYVWKAKVYETKDEIYEEVADILHSLPTNGRKELLRIHPSFKGRWSLIRELLSNEKHLSKMYLYTHGNAYLKTYSNSACINISERVQYSTDLALIVPLYVFDNKITVKMFKPVELPTEYEQFIRQDDEVMMGVYNGEDYEGLDAWCREKGYDFNYSTQQVYEMRIYAPVKSNKKKRLVIVDELTQKK